MSIEKVAELIRSARLDLSSEKRAQAGLESLLKAHGIPFEREVRLSDRDVIDFVIGSIGVELKVSGNKKAIYKQLCRYAVYPQVGSLMLATNLSMGLPSHIEGKDAYLVRLGEGWL